jgi:hypothetical protein
MEDSLTKCQLLTAAVNGGIHPVDLFTQSGVWLVVADALWACLAMVEADGQETA